MTPSSLLPEERYYPSEQALHLLQQLQAVQIECNGLRKAVVQGRTAVQALLQNQPSFARLEETDGGILANSFLSDTRHLA